MAIISNGTTIADAGAFSVNLGSMVHIKTLTASSSGTLSFVHGTDGVVLDSTYPIYKFEFIGCHPATNNGIFSFQGSTDGGSNYNIAMTTTWFYAGHAENGGGGYLVYGSAADQANGTAFQRLSAGIFNDNDNTLDGELSIYNPSSTTFVKHFMSRNATKGDEANDVYIAGYFNTTSALNAFQFKFNSGNIDAGKIKLYGIKDS